LAKIRIDTTVYTVSPAAADRLQIEMDTYRLLEKLGIPFFRLDHDATASVDDCAEVEKLLDIEICKNLFLTDARKTKFFMLTMPGAKRYKAGVLSAQIHSSRLSFADASYMEKYLGLSPGAVSILGLMNDKNRNVELLLDRDAVKPEFIGCHPCVNTSSLKLRTLDILEKFLPFTGHPPRFVEL
jgi:Ala-tRNA(Pro) deacylase